MCMWWARRKRRGTLRTRHRLRVQPGEGKVVEKLQAFKSGEVEEELADIAGVAVDASGVLWVYWEEQGIIDGFANS